MRIIQICKIIFLIPLLDYTELLAELADGGYFGSCNDFALWKTYPQPILGLHYLRNDAEIFVLFPKKSRPLTSSSVYLIIFGSILKMILNSLMPTARREGIWAEALGVILAS